MTSDMERDAREYERSDMATATDTWEYLLAPVLEDEKLTVRNKKRVLVEPDQLNELGKQGWEAVGITLHSGTLYSHPVVLMKRAVK